MIRNLRYTRRFCSDGSALRNAFLRSVKDDAATSPPAAEQRSKSPPTTLPKASTPQVSNFWSPKVDNSADMAHHAAQALSAADEKLLEFAPSIKVIGVGGGGCNAVNNMINRGLRGVDFICANTDAQHLAKNMSSHKIQLGRKFTQGLGCGADPNSGRAAAEESRDDILEAVEGAHMVFLAAGMGGGTGTGAAPVIAEICAEKGILTVAVVTLPFAFEGRVRSRLAEEGRRALFERVDTLIVIPNQNLLKLENAYMLNAFGLANDVLLAGIKNITDLMTKPGLINLDFADVRSIMSGMGNAIMGTGQANGEDRAVAAAKDALSNPLLGAEMSIRSAKGLLVNITGGSDLTLYEVNEAAEYITSEISDENANIIFGSSYDPDLEGEIRVSVVATGIESV